MDFRPLMEITERPEIVFVEGRGSWLTDHAGKRYLDFVQGWAVNCLGHCPPAVVEALGRAVADAHHAESRLLQRAVAEAGASARRALRFSAVLLHQLGSGGQRRRHQAGPQVGPALQGWRVRDHHLRPRLSRAHPRHHVRERQARLGHHVRAAGARLSQGHAERPCLGGGVDRRADRGGDAGAGAGRERRGAGHRRVPPGAPGADPAAPLSAHRGRGADRHRPHRPSVRVPALRA